VQLWRALRTVQAGGERRVRSYQEQYLDTLGVFGPAIIGLLAAIAKQEQLRLSERTKAGLQRARAKGVQLGRQRAQVDVKRIRQLHRRGAKNFGCSVSASNPFSSKQGEWRNLQGIDIHNNNRKGRFRQYRMYDPDFHPLTYAHMMEEYIRHAEAKSLGPDGKPCTNSVRNAENAAHEGAVGTREC